MSSEILLFALLVVLVASTALEQLARALQVRHQPPEPPAELAGAVDEVAYATAQRYARDRGRLGAARSVTLLAVWITLLASGALAGAHPGDHRSRLDAGVMSARRGCGDAVPITRAPP